MTLEYALPVAFALLVWWFGTGIVLMLDRLPRRTFRWSIAVATLLLGFAFWGLVETRDSETVFSAYAAFVFAVMIWGWHELVFLLGVVTGPRKEPCPEQCDGLRRFNYAVRAIFYHELALAATAAAVAALTWGSANETALWTFLTLWLMRLSAKLNIFFGVPNHAEEFLPDHLFYLKSYFRKASMNLFFPVSVTAATVALSLLVDAASSPAATSFEAHRMALIVALLALAILEHWLLVLPLTATAPWGIVLRLTSGEKTAGQADPHSVAAASPSAARAVPERAPQDSALQSWGTRLAPDCDAQVLGNLLDALADGRFGDVECVFGVARTGADWVHFNIERGHPSVLAFEPRKREQPCVVAIGRRLDKARLLAAFDACAVSTTGGVC